ncbi:MAG: dihydrofolate reductase family protein [Catenulisporales bacterium]|nr:dihydrofolate reductase family protein [Catenulisporales bacterium]
MSLDGHLDDTTPTRLLLSDTEDFDRVDALRAASDAIMVGAETIRRDNPRLLVNNPERRAERLRRGLPEYPIKVTVTGTGALDAGARFFTTGGDKLVYCADLAVPAQAERLHGVPRTEVVPAGDLVDFPRILADLRRRGVKRLMVEGGSSLHTRFLAEDLADEIHLAIAPFFVGDDRAPRFVKAADFPQDAQHRMTLAEVRPIGADLVFVRYLINH